MAHVQGKVAGADKEYIGAFQLCDLFEIVHGLFRLDLEDREECVIGFPEIIRISAPARPAS